MENKIDVIASNIMEYAFRSYGSLNRCPIGFGYEDLSDKERLQVLKLIEKYGDAERCIPGSWIFERYTLTEKGKQFHEEHDNYLNYLEKQKQIEQDRELDRESKRIAIKTAEETVRLAEEANRLSAESNITAKNANKKANTANIISIIAIILTIISIVLSLLLK